MERHQCLRQKERAINIPRLNTEQMRKIKTGWEELFKDEINPLTAELQPDSGDWDRRYAFEGAYEASRHKIRIHILQALNRDIRKLHGVRQVNARFQAAREQTEQVINYQLIRRTLSKMRNIFGRANRGRLRGSRKGQRRRRKRRRRRRGRGKAQETGEADTAGRSSPRLNHRGHDQECIWDTGPQRDLE
jgi:hypothetical protein